MKQFLTTLLFIPVLLFSFSPLSLAQGTQNYKNALKCGKLNNVCCTRLEFKPEIPNFLEGLPFPIDKVAGAIVSVANTIVVRPITPILEGLSDLVLKSLGVNIDTSKPYCVKGKPETIGSECRCIDDKIVKLARLCGPISAGGEKTKCLDCVTNGKGVWTGLGCLYTDPSKLIEKNILGFGIGIAGGAAFLCILYAAFLMQTSSGNPERLKKAREYLTNCITGLLLIIFSVLILRLIGLNILGIPGFK